MHYYAKIKKTDGVYLVSFPDFPNINTYGETKPEAVQSAAEALNGVLETDFERGFEIPKAKMYKGIGYYTIPVAPHIAIAYTLRQLRKNASQSDIAKRLGISYQAYQKLENPRHSNPTLKTLEKISAILGKQLEIKIS